MSVHLSTDSYKKADQNHRDEYHKVATFCHTHRGRSRNQLQTAGGGAQENEFNMKGGGEGVHKSIALCNEVHETCL